LAGVHLPWLVAALLGWLATSTVSGQLIFDATADFSVINGNPNGVWSYGWMPTDFTAFNLYTNNHCVAAASPLHWFGFFEGTCTPCVWKHMLGGTAWGVPPGWVSLHPGPGNEPSVLRWTSPSSGLVRIQGRFLAGDSGTMLVAVRMDGETRWERVDSGEFDLLETVGLGGTVDFAVYGGYCCGNTPLEATITLDAMGGWVSLSERYLEVPEDQSEVTVNLLLARGTNDQSLRVSVDYATVDDTARAGEDYVARSGTLSFAPGENNKQIVIPLLNDTIREAKENFHLLLSNPTAGVSLGTSSVLIWIQDEDPTTLHVWQESPSPAPPYTTWETAAHTIQDAVDEALPSETILVTNGVYETGGTVNRLALRSPVVVRSVNGPEVTIIRGQEGMRGAYVGANAVLSGFTLANGYAREGGGVWSEPSGVVTNCVLCGNWADWGGGGVSGGTLYNCTLSSNSAGDHGGGASGSTLYTCMLTGNSAQYNGGGAAQSTLYDCVVNSNAASWGGGGGIWGGTLYNCTLVGNLCLECDVFAGGGGAFEGILYNCILIGNSAWASGGDSYATLYNCTLVGNSATGARGWGVAAELYGARFTAARSSETQ
jgi:hypothetical protein